MTIRDLPLHTPIPWVRARRPIRYELRNGAECAAAVSLPDGGASPADASAGNRSWRLSRRGSVAPTLVIEELGNEPNVTQLGSKAVLPLVGGGRARWQRTRRGGVFVAGDPATIVVAFEHVRQAWFRPSELRTTIAAAVTPDTALMIVLGCYLLHLAHYDDGVNAASAIGGVLSS